MAEQSYPYTISSDFPDGAVNQGKLVDEIRASAIVTALERITHTGDSISIVFKAPLSAGDKTLLDGDTTGPAGGLIAAHDNTPSVPTPTTKLLDGSGAVVNLFQTSLGRLLVNPDVIPKGYHAYYTGAFDDVASGNRGEGAFFHVTKTDEGEATALEGQFLEHVYLVAGDYRCNGNIAFHDWASMEAWAPASSPEDRTTTHDGNANKSPTGLGFNIIVPAPLNDGDWNVDGAVFTKGEINTDLVPVPNETRAGYWNWDPTLAPAATITPVANPAEPDGNYDLFDAQLHLNRQANKIPLYLNGGCCVEHVRAGLVLPHWKIKFRLYRSEAGQVDAVFVLKLGRKKTHGQAT
jgi:hypothetical protein